MKRVRTFILSLLFPALLSSLSISGAERKVIVVFAQFPDLQFSHGRTQLDSLCLALSTYYNSQALPGRTFRFDAGPIVTLEKSFAHYGANTTDMRDALAGSMAAEACRKADEDVDFSAYDNGNGTTVNDLLIMVPGKSEAYGAGDDYFWPQTISLVKSRIYLALDKRRIDNFAVVSELGPGGSFTGTGDLAHEYGHLMGLKDYYDTDGDLSGGVSKALWGITALMDKGNRNDNGRTPPNLNAIDRELLEAGGCEVLEKPGDYTLEPITRNGRYAKILSDISSEYYLLECREESGNDAFIGGSGMLVYHVDRSGSDAATSSYYQRTLSALERWSFNEVNCNPSHECARLVAADPSATSAAGIFWPAPGKTVLGSDSNPSLRFWDGSTGLLALRNIHKFADGTIGFSLVEPLHIEKIDVFQNSTLLNWTAGVSDIDSCRVFWTPIKEGSETSSIKCTVAPEMGVPLEGLEPNTGYRYLIRLFCSDGSSFSAGGSFRTLVQRTDVFRCILLRGVLRNTDGSFATGTKIPLVVFNTSGTEHIAWSFNGTEIHPGNDGRWTVRESGILRAEVTDADGGRDIIIKEIVVR